MLRGVLILLDLVYARLDNGYVRPNEVSIIFNGLREFALIYKRHRSTVLVAKLTSSPSNTIYMSDFKRSIRSNMLIISSLNFHTRASPTFFNRPPSVILL